MNHSTRGAARVSAVWLIVLIVVALVAFVFAFIANSDRADALASLAEARQVETRALERYDVRSQEMSAISEDVGWTTGEGAIRQTDVAAMSAAVSELREAFGLDSTYGTIEKVFPEVIAAHNADRRQVNELENRITQLQSEIAASQQTTTQVSEDKEGTIRDLRQQMSDDQSNAQQRQDELEERVQRLETQVTDLDRQLREARLTVADRDRNIAQLERTHEARVRELNRVTRPFKEPLDQLPDGEILAVSDELPLGWIDVGATDRLVVGTSFEVWSGSQSSPRYKGRATVTRTQPNKSQVSFTGLADRNDPIVAGDIVTNRLYDPRGEYNAVLLGNFSAPYDERELTALLDRIGIKVQQEVGLTTHFLIVGSELWEDEEGTPLDEPLQPSELPAYRDAEALGCVIIPIQDLRSFFKI